MKRWFFAIVFLFLGGDTVPLMADAPVAFMQSLKGVKYHTIMSADLGRSFHIYVKLPKEYGRGPEKYPVIYLLDGGYSFPMLAAYSDYLRFEQLIPEVIIVGISYGNDDWGKGNFRSTDFTAKAQSRDHYGGAPVFQKFLADELFPFIENEYAGNRQKRILFGQSLGGQFVLHVAKTKPDLFWGYIASNPALHRNLEYFLEKQKIMADSKPYLYVSSGGEDEERFGKPAEKWMGYWAEREEAPWRLRIEKLEGLGHFSAAPEAFRRGLVWMLEGERRK